MRYYEVKPLVAGELSEGTVMDTSVHPPIVSKLHYQFDAWLGDVLVTSFPCFLVTEEAKRGLLAIGISGATFADAEVTISEDFYLVQPDVELPPFVWLKVDGRAGHDDFGINQNLNLVMSERAFDVLDELLGLPSASIKRFDDGNK
ncbi:hypothetical protein MEA186_05461 [Mesorhizobium amorphae CCNWGS0123]|uniref:Uncharacterized protein n=2 Tax=Mesorhizobium amorphae TaxID=71433 RepID=G6Y583_9HYPH|nr:hypothetical protein A6B35_15550 [Mesorhizobium amorphae CCNWGS0123]EHH13134.1 hypothetical protein MEA186_05461 [Mesorhizobium amorphae CCNWGS0123]